MAEKLKSKNVRSIALRTEPAADRERKRRASLAAQTE